MDTFENQMKEIAAIKKQERWKIYDGKKGACVCPSCPSYNTCADKGDEVLFCILGMSFKCIRDDLGCICPGCALYPEYGLSKKDYCMKGSEKDQRWDERAG